LYIILEGANGPPKYPDDANPVAGDTVSVGIVLVTVIVADPVFPALSVAVTVITFFPA
jgi:hypothetical protein